jgi:hypothetical protein
MRCHAVAQGGMAVVHHVDLPTARVRLISTPVSCTVCQFLATDVSERNCASATYVDFHGERHRTSSPKSLIYLALNGCSSPVQSAARAVAVRAGQAHRTWHGFLGQSHQD